MKDLYDYGSHGLLSERDGAYRHSRQNAFRHICASAISDSRRRSYPLGGQAGRVGGSQSEESRHRGMAVYPRCGGGRPCDAGGGQRLQTIRQIPFRPSRRWWSLPTLRTRNGTKLQSGYSEQRGLVKIYYPERSLYYGKTPTIQSFPVMLQ